MKQESTIALSVLDLATVREGGTVAESFRHTVKLAQAAETRGDRRFWLAEQHNLPGSASAATSVLIGHVAGATKTIRVGSGGSMLPNHSPLLYSDFYRLADRLHSYEIVAGLFLKPINEQK
jgi:alkanesulfonate monooxygenase SsuD/methylene tetrahydromethanopterin reductase-like flavin-dependent oxidoreductase (luciferase family)